LEAQRADPGDTDGQKEPNITCSERSGLHFGERKAIGKLLRES
jgi:hypothetical protein